MSTAIDSGQKYGHIPLEPYDFENDPASAFPGLVQQNQWTKEWEEDWIKDLGMQKKEFMWPKGPLAGKFPVELKPKWKVTPAEPDQFMPYYPHGILKFNVRMPGKDKQLPDIVKCEYFKTMLVEAIAEAYNKLLQLKGEDKLVGQDVLMCMPAVALEGTSLPHMGDVYWQWAWVRFEYKLALKSEADVPVFKEAVFDKMGKFMENFKEKFENKWKDIYILHMMQMDDKQKLLFDSTKLMQQFELYEAAGKGDVDKVKKLLPGLEVDYQATIVDFPMYSISDEEARTKFAKLGRTPLQNAADNNQIEVMRVLLDSKASVDKQDYEGATALYISAGKEGDTGVKLLLGFGAKINHTTKAFATPMHMACTVGDIATIKTLGSAKADLNAMTPEGGTPLHTAVQNDKIDALKELQQLKCNMNCPAPGGNTAMHEAVIKNSPTLIKELSRLGCDCNIESGPTNEYQTPLKMAITRRRKRATKALKDLGAIEQLEHEYDDESDWEATGDGEYIPVVRGRIPVKYV
eukprot:gnl/MRDRNA2_/MRDRNA2_98625_c0_seq1.p1 gnl/MRDRNA2_/MRDRNA2_98625_c0~~gnl/MRDRNA2_/MRDRNA2_98625_c0_seq1.p1  ORF type:complete len:553 (-),score=140.99 gnl/MRDRNA2_/MRDRNA2_98625_c0_seq1:146-1702(-)